MKINKIILVFSLLFISLFTSCNKNNESEEQVDEGKIVEQMKSLSSLGTVEYSFSKLIKCSDEQIYSIGERKIMMSCKAYVKAGVNFEKISVPNIDFKNKSIEIILPKGEVILMNIPAEDIKIENEKTGFFRGSFSNIEIQNIQVLAEKEISQKLKDFNITDKAEANATIFLDKWIRTFGFKNVKISTK
jgi:hypothetical protein